MTGKYHFQILVIGFGKRLWNKTYHFHCSKKRKRLQYYFDMHPYIFQNKWVYGYYYPLLTIRTNYSEIKDCVV